MCWSQDVLLIEVSLYMYTCMQYILRGNKMYYIMYELISG